MGFPKKKYQGFLFAFLLGIHICIAQHTNIITASINHDLKEVSIQQEFEYVNNSDDTLEILYFNDWANSYSDKNTELAKRFAEEFKKSLHLAKDDERGSTNIISAVDDDYRGLRWQRTDGKDIIKLELNKRLGPKESAKFYITYTVKLPPNKFTPYGYSNKDEYYLKDWYLTPAVYDGQWHLYSNVNLEDLYTDVTNTTLTLKYPKNLFLASNFRVLGTTVISNYQESQMEGIGQKSCELVLSPTKKFTTHITPEITVITDIEANKYDQISQGVSINRITKFIAENLGKFPHQQLLVSEIDYEKNPLYGINQLPSFIRPYEEQFQFEMKFLKTALMNVLEETIYLDPRKEQWVTDAIANYLMIAYVESYYPHQKLLGKLSTVWGIRWFNLAKMEFNEQYSFLYMLTARRNSDQPLETPNDSLIKFNQKIANKYKAGLGLAYLASYIGKDRVDESIKTFFSHYSLNKVKVDDFESILKRSSNTDMDWFFSNYVSSDRRIDYKIKKIEKSEDSLRVTLKNKEGTVVPISLFGLKKDSIISKYWLSEFDGEKTFTLPRNGEDKLVLNYDQKIPEFNQRDNWKSLGGFLSSNKKLNFTFFRDSENPYLNQIFYVPLINFNVYDGWAPGMRLYNKTLLERPFVYDIAPSYSFRENSFVGFGRLNYRKYLSKTGLYVANYGLRGSTSHFDINSRYSTLTPSISFGWRPDNLLSNERQALLFRYVNIFRNLDESLQSNEKSPASPNYSIFDVRYGSVDNNIINYKSWQVDFQHASKFTKLIFEAEYRKLFESNRQLNLRFYVGKFLRNKTEDRFFNFALDRPTDYLFDYGYLGRSEGSGIYSQQIIIAEGGFKSFLDERYRFSNDWLTTLNASVNLWRWIELYGDIGVVKNKGERGKFVYDSGVRLNLVTDYFELYFPLYSNNGWEVSQPNYGEKIRFIVTVSPRTLIGLFTRKWL